ncbi:thiamine pyrophosphate-dependent enzyme [Secundilactobacillus oryzae]|nr:thiamine pyrophosphate-dependent enzyme [Secundilactobacillus oryzae]
MTQMKASQALAQVLEAWDIKRVYGIPADTVIDGFYQERDKIEYIQVRHEEVGSLAAVATAKATGKIGVMCGSVGPGALHLLYGLYDAKMDHVPVLAIVGQSETKAINTAYLQEMDEDAWFTDFSDFHKQITTAEQIPAIVDAAIRYAYDHKGPAIIIMPDDLPAQTIEFEPIKTKPIHQVAVTSQIEEADVQETLQRIRSAKHPLLLVGQGMVGKRDIIQAFSEKFKIPVVTSAPAIKAVSTTFENNLGSMGRIGTKPAFEAGQLADLLIMVGTNYPFARFLPKNQTVIQIDTRLSALGRQVQADQAVVADGGQYLQAVYDAGNLVPFNDWLKANRTNRQNWQHYLTSRVTQAGPLTPEAVINTIKQHAEKDAYFALDVGNNVTWASRQLPFDANQDMSMSSWIGTMGYGLGAGLAVKLEMPERQVFSIMGDGGFTMVSQDLLTQVQYQTPVITVIMKNSAFGFISHEESSRGQADYGVQFVGANWAGVAENMGAHGFQAGTQAELDQVFEQVRQLQQEGNHQPIVIEATIKNEDPVDTSFMPLDSNQFDTKTIKDFREKYGISEQEQPALSTLL